MKTDTLKILAFLAVSGILFGVWRLFNEKELPLFVPLAFAHCDTLGGPVIKAAQRALETGDIDRVLIWIQKQDEEELRGVFQKTMAVRKMSPEAQELADLHFFETLVRIHRAGEGAPFTGLKPAGTEEPPIAAADKAVESGTVDTLIKDMSAHVAEGIQERFEKMMEKKKHMDESVEAGRDYVAAYVTFIHYVERLYMDAVGRIEHEGETQKAETVHKH
ncbi:MAG: DUF6448 family protein [Acidobacteriota bacterium]|nr:DUF6448 family protein [Acidobacteriota bacterium]